MAQRLREAGAVILGKTNLSEWANFRSTHSTSGWSGRGGQTQNPYALDRNPCGSSSGSGAAVRANLCAAAVGTETDGSIVCPSSANGIVGIKPTVGLVSRAGIIPISHSQDTRGTDVPHRARCGDRAGRADGRGCGGRRHGARGENCRPITPSFSKAMDCAGRASAWCASTFDFSDTVGPVMEARSTR